MSSISRYVLESHQMRQKKQIGTLNGFENQTTTGELETMQDFTWKNFQKRSTSTNQAIGDN